MSQQIIDEIEQVQTFQKFELVWAKILGWPWWPARITQIPSGKNENYRVQFFADTSHAFLPAEKLMCFAQGRDRHSTPKGHYRNFAKALALANKLLQSRTSVKDEVQSQSTSREKLIPQQIQIINYSQQVKTQPKAGQQINIEAEKEQNDSNEVEHRVRKAKKLIKRRQIIKHKPKGQEKQEDQQEVNTLLKKYNLQHVMDKRTKPNCVKQLKKRKIIRKNLLENSSTRARALTARLICKALSCKDMSLQQRHNISLCLMDSFFANREKGVQGMHRALFQWIRCNDTQAIMKNYTTWPADIKCDHFTDCS